VTGEGLCSISSPWASNSEYEMVTTELWAICMKKSSSGKKARVPGGGWSGKAGAMEGLD
jgi:hypothetical protein